MGYGPTMASPPGRQPTTDRSPGSTIRTYVLWGGLLGATLQGFWLVTSIHIVVDVQLDALELILLGTVLEITILTAEVPTGVVADTVSRKWSIVTSMTVIAIAFLLAAATSTFAWLAIAMVLWGIGWTFTSGADVAWVTDELAAAGGSPALVDRTLARKAAWFQWGGALGLAGFGLLGWLTTTATAMATAGFVMAGLAVLVSLTFTERGFAGGGADGPSARVVLRAGIEVVRADRVIARILVVTVLFNLGAEAIDRLPEKRLIDLGLPDGTSPVLFFTGLGLLGLAAGAALLRILEPTIATSTGPRRVYAAMAGLAALGAVLIALVGIGDPAPGSVGPLALGAAGIVATRGLAWAVLPVAAAVWVNRGTTSATRATVQSFVGQADAAGQIVGGLAIGWVARAAGIPAAVTIAAALFAAAGLVVLTGRSPARGAGSEDVG